MINFTPGPSQLYFTVDQHIRNAMRAGVGSLSHRSRSFEDIFVAATGGLRELLDIPRDYHVFFCGSATEIWERVIQNLVEAESFHLVNGAFSKRFFEIAQQTKKAPLKAEVAAGYGFDQAITVPPGSELIAVTHNETSTGVMLPPQFINDLREKHPEKLIVVDSVSSLPYAAFDFTKLDSVFFSVQKGFGLPAGLGVWIVNDRCLAKADLLQSRGVPIGSYHNLPTLYSNAKKDQTPETPNVLAIYLLGKVIQDMLAKGIEKIRRETDYKAAVLYKVLEDHPTLGAFVLEKQWQSKTVITVDCGSHTDRVAALLQEEGFLAGAGYGENRKTQLRFANFPTHSKETFEKLADAFAAMKLS